jgi:hypothetical protein
MEEFSFYIMLLIVYLTCSMNRIRVPSFVDSVLRRGLQFGGFQFKQSNYTVATHGHTTSMIYEASGK